MGMPIKNAKLKMDGLIWKESGDVPAERLYRKTETTKPRK
jgi:hypothetical protein